MQASNTNARVVREVKKFQTDPIPGIQFKTDPDNVNHFFASIQGPPHSLYQGGVFSVQIMLPKDYPMVFPSVVFQTKIYHPNVDPIGRICLDVLKDNWTPNLQMKTILLSVQNLLIHPDASDALNNKAGKQWFEDEKKSQKKARQWTKQYAKKK